VLAKLLVKQELVRKIAEQATTEGGGEESKKEKEVKDRDQVRIYKLFSKLEEDLYSQ